MPPFGGDDFQIARQIGILHLIQVFHCKLKLSSDFRLPILTELHCGTEFLIMCFAALLGACRQQLDVAYLRSNSDRGQLAKARILFGYFASN